MRKCYPSDASREQFAAIYPAKPFRAGLKKTGWQGTYQVGQGRKLNFAYWTHKALRIRSMPLKKAMMQKKASSIKRHIVVDTQGLPHAIVITTANVTRSQRKN